MIEIALDYPRRINDDALQRELADVLGDKIDGYASGRGKLRVIFRQQPTDDDIAAAAAVVDAHDADALTDDQQAEVTRKSRIQAAIAEVRGYDLTQPLTAAQNDKATRLLLLHALRDLDRQ